MMNFNHKIISRKRLKEILENEKEENFVPDSEFEQEALEGWKKSGLKMNVMKKMDQQLWLKSNSIYFILSTVLISTLIIVALNPSADNKKSLVSSTENHIQTETEHQPVPHEKDSVIHTAAFRLKQTILPKQIIETQKELKLDQHNPKNEIIYLPLKKADLIQHDRENSNLLAKEVYLYDFKLIDYRQYRSVEMEQKIFSPTSGLPADQEKYSSEENEEGPKKYQVAYYDYIKKTMFFFKEGKYERALQRYQIILETYPEDLNALFYGGLSAYNLGDYPKAYAYFQKLNSKQMSNFNEEAEWYSAKSLLESGETAKAKDLLKKIASQKGFYAKQAQKLLKE